MEQLPYSTLVPGEVAPRKCDYRIDRYTDRQTDGQTVAGQSDPYVPLCFAGDTKMKVIRFFKIDEFINRWVQNIDPIYIIGRKKVYIAKLYNQVLYHNSVLSTK